MVGDRKLYLAAVVALLGCSEDSKTRADQTFDPVASDDAGSRVPPVTGATGGEPPAPSSAVDAGFSGDATTSDPNGLDGSTPVAVPCGEIGWNASASGMRFAGVCEGTSLTLVPIAKVDGAWVGGGRTGPCSVEDARVVCSAGAAGQLEVDVEEGKLRASLRTSSAVTVQALGLEGSLELPGATGFLSNGLQSWSQSGVLALGSVPDADALAQALNARGEDEVYRKGAELSWWHTFVGGGAMSFSAGAVSAERLRSYTQTYRVGDRLHVLLISGAGEKIAAKQNERVAGEWFRIEVGDDLEPMLRRYGGELPSRRKQHPVPVPAGWNSWYDLWDDVRADQIVSPGATRNADLAKSMLAAALPKRDAPTWIVVDDGWQKAWGDWTTNDKFPDGLDGLAKAIKARGLAAGVWFAPLLVDPSTDVAQQHPDWLVKDAVYNHPSHGDMGVLDVTHPEAAAHLERVVRGFVSAGMGLLKADFLFAGTWEGGRHEQVTGMQAYARAMALIRKAAGESTLLVAVGAPPLVTFEYVDAWRVGNDIAFKPLPLLDRPRPSFSFIANQARQVTSRWAYCLATLCDADPMLLRTLDREEVDVGAWVVAATGGALFLSDDLTKLPQERRTWGLDAARVSLGLGGEPATPESFFPGTLPKELVNMKDGLFTAEHDIPSIWRLPDGKRLGFNFKDAATEVEGTMIPGHAVRALSPRAP